MRISELRVIDFATFSGSTNLWDIY
jgi:hypothetical protein